MSLIDNNSPLKIVAWLLHYVCYPIWMILGIFAKKEDRLQAPQFPRIIVVTGCSQGIGEGLVEYYYRNCSSCQTIIMISRNVERLEAIKNRLSSDDEKQVVIYPCDVVDADRMKSVLHDIHRAYGQIDILFANAGVSFRQLSLAGTLDRAVRETVNVNINGVINTIMPLIELKGVRQIAIVSSQAAYAPIVSPVYGATKQCVLTLGLDLRRILAKEKIAVNVISPGPVATPMLVGSYPRSVKHSVSTDEAAHLIFQGLRRNEAEIVFPLVTGIFQYTLSFLPSSIAETIGSFVLRNQ